MADIIPLSEKIQQTKTRQAAMHRMRKIAAVQKVFQCSQCPHRCEKCGVQIVSDEDGDELKLSTVPIPFRFCSSCSAEYLDFIERLKGGGDPECFWHNDLWVENWQKWIEFKNSTERYMKSEEFKQIVEEIRRTAFDE